MVVRRCMSTLPITADIWARCSCWRNGLRLQPAEHRGHDVRHRDALHADIVAARLVVAAVVARSTREVFAAPEYRNTLVAAHEFAGIRRTEERHDRRSYQTREVERSGI